MIDFINSVDDLYDQISIYSNDGGIFPEEIQRLNKEAKICPSHFITRGRVLNFLKEYPRIYRRLVSLALLALAPVLFCVNVFGFVLLLFVRKPEQVIAFSGGYPTVLSTLSMTVASRISGIPVMLSVVSVPMVRKPAFLLIERILDATVWRCVDWILVNAEAIGVALMKSRGAPARKIRIVHNAIEDFGAGQPPRANNNDLVIGLVSRLDSAKGVLFLWDAFVILLKQFPDLKLVLAGDGDCAAEIREKVLELGLQKNVSLLGHYSGDVSPLIASFDIYVFPSLWEGFPYSILEVLRAGRPLVATNVGGVAEAVDNGVEGILIEPGNAMAIVEATKLLITNQELRLTLSKMARLRFERQFTLQRMRADFQRVILDSQ